MSWLPLGRYDGEIRPRSAVGVYVGRLRGLGIRFRLVQRASTPDDIK